MMKHKWIRNASNVKGCFVSDKSIISVTIDEAKDATRRSLAQFGMNFSSSFVFPKYDPAISNEIYNFDSDLLPINPT